MAAACKEGCGAVSGGDGTLYCGVRQIQLLLDGEVASSLGSVEISQPFSPIR